MAGQYPEAQVPKIFISYRRDDSRDITGRIADHLAKHFGPEQIFRDVDAIAPAHKFADEIHAALEDCEVFLAIIGPDWLDAKGSDGTRRIDNEEDYVRTEVKAALDRRIPIIPVLVGDASIPGKADLPGSIATIADWQAIEVSSGKSFQGDVERLLFAIDQLFGLRLQRLILKSMVALAALVVAGVAAWLVWSNLLPAPRPVVIAMDSRMEHNIYDQESYDAGRTNADDIKEVLDDLPIEFDTENTMPGWQDDGYIKRRHPRLIIIHVSCFYDDNFLSQSQTDERFWLFVDDMLESTNVVFLAYTRGLPKNPDAEQVRRWNEHLEKRKAPKYQGRLKVFEAGWEHPSFRHPDTKRRLRSEVRELLALP